jgi:5-methylcytosine-specific restriction endonuclease McrA
MSDEEIENRRTFIEQRVPKIEEMLCHTNLDTNIRDKLEREMDKLLEEYDKLPCKLPTQEVNSYPIYLQTERPFVYKNNHNNWVVKKVNNKWALYDEDFNELLTNEIEEENGIPVQAIMAKQNINTKGRLVRSIHELKIDISEPQSPPLKVNAQERQKILESLRERFRGIDYKNLHYHKIKMDLLETMSFVSGEYVGTCAKCGSNNILEMEIDHIMGNGADERRKYPSYVEYYAHILDEVLNGSKNYQLLCKKCHSEKTRLECAHGSKSRKRVLDIHRKKG